MSHHAFLLEPKKWLGSGKINLSMVEEELEFYTRWNLEPSGKKGDIAAHQEVQIKGMSEVMVNQFKVSGCTPTKFKIELENAALGAIIGKGIIKGNLIAWEFRDVETGFEGFEFYEKQEDGTYLMRAEYATPDQHRTVIRGTLWEKVDQT